MSAAAVTSGIRNLLIGSAPLAALLSAYKGNPAVFMVDPVPENAQLPYVVSKGVEDLGTPLDLDGKFRAVDFSVQAFAEATGDPLPVDQIADQVADLFRVPTSLSIAGFTVKHTIVSGPALYGTDPDTYGRTVEVRCMIYPSP